MSGYIVRNQLMTDMPWGGTQSPTSMLSPTLPNALTTATPTDAWGAPMNVQPASMGIRPEPNVWGTPPMQAGTGGPTMAVPAGGNPALPSGAMSNDDLAKLLAQFYGGQAQNPQAPTPQQQLQQAIDQDAAYRGREGGGLV